MPVPARPAYHLYHWLWTGLDWLYPPRCGGCGKAGKRWCDDCQRNALVISPPICQRCGQSQASGGICTRCLSTPPHYSALRSWAVFTGPVRHALHRLKYAGDIGLGDALANHLVDLLVNLQWKVDLVIPVPLSLSRQKQRGYNQAALLARPAALALRLTYQPNALIKIRETPSQVGLNLEQRRENVAGVFNAKPQFVTGKKILLVDDVTTSGATLDSCAEALVESGAGAVYALTFARAASV